MHRSILLRLLPAARAGDRLAGVAEEVETGERLQGGSEGATPGSHDAVEAAEPIAPQG